MPDLHAEIRDSLNAASKSIARLRRPLTDFERISEMQRTLVTLHDTCANLARAIGVPDAVETVPGAKPHVTTDVVDEHQG